MDIKVEIKEEPVWLEESPADTINVITDSSEDPLQNEFKVKEEIQEVEIDIASLKNHIAVEQLPSLPLEPYRLPVEILATQDPSASFLFNGAVVAEKCLLEEKKKASCTQKTKKCEICGKEFWQVLLLRKHMLHHKLKELHQCEVCEKVFTTVSSLNKHYCSHETKISHKCTVCGKRFIYLYNLRLHRIVHKYKNTYSCAVCEKSFMSKSILKKHYLTHG